MQFLGLISEAPSALAGRFVSTTLLLSSPRGSCCSPVSEIGGGRAHSGQPYSNGQEAGPVPEKQGRQVVLTTRPVPQHFHLGAGADGVAAAVGAARVGSLVSQLNVAYDQASILGQVDAVTVCPHWDTIPVMKSVLYHCSHPWELKKSLCCLETDAS